MKKKDKTVVVILSDSESDSSEQLSSSDESSESDCDNSSQKDGIIYMITNKINGKIYIGGMIENGGYNINSRLQKHIYSALHPRKGSGSTKLNEAIKEHGKENFSIKELMRCTSDSCFDNEVKQIEKYNSRDSTIGYNVAIGGKGMSKNNANEKIKNELGLQDNKETNILPIVKNEEHVGYRVKFRKNGKQYDKWFTKTKYTPEENLKSAKEWLENFKKDIPNETTKESKLPKNISYLKNRKGENAGYRVNILQKGIRYDKSFQDGDDMKEKLEKAIEYKNKILNAK